MRRQFSHFAGVRTPRHLDSSAISIREPTIVREADAIRAVILRQAKSAKADGVDMGDDLGPMLDTYVDQIQTLTLKHDEMAAVASGGALQELQDEHTDLVERHAKSTTDEVRGEYDKSIAEVDQQIASIREIDSSREVLELRLRSAMNVMKQLKLDLTRVRGGHDRKHCVFRSTPQQIRGTHGLRFGPRVWILRARIVIRYHPLRCQ